MNVTIEELNDFHDYALQKVINGGTTVSLEQLLHQWRNEMERLEVNRAICEGLADMKTGNYRSLDEFMDEFRETHNLSNDS